MTLMKKKEGKCCGTCCWFKHEDISGWGICYHNEREYFSCSCKCTDLCDNYTGRSEYRHHIAMLLQANRYRRDQNVPSIYRMPNPRELGKAIDFAVTIMKAFEDM